MFILLSIELFTLLILLLEGARMQQGSPAESCKSSELRSKVLISLPFSIKFFTVSFE
jgi:hypothetical protein